jgi:hypothetical protein
LVFLFFLSDPQADKPAWRNYNIVGKERPMTYDELRLAATRLPHHNDLRSLKH